MNGINFSMDGPMMTGTWYNPNTKDSFTVRDTFFENNQLLVSTTDGRMLDYNMIQSYVQCDAKDIPALKQQPSLNKSEDIPAEVMSILESPSPQDPNMLEEDMALISGHTTTYPTHSLGSLNNPVLKSGIGQSEDQRLVERVLSRQQQPSINCNINWPKFPQKQMDVLMDMMGVDIEDVCDFYISKINLNDIRESIKRDIKTYIEIAMGYVEPEVIDPKTSSVLPEVVVTPCDYKESVTEQEGEQIQPKKKTTRPTKKTTKKK
jgi:hypothetical protein